MTNLMPIYIMILECVCCEAIRVYRVIIKNINGNIEVEMNKKCNIDENKSVGKKKTIFKKILKLFLCLLLMVVLVNVLAPLFCKKPDEEFAENLKKTESVAWMTMKMHFCGAYE